MLKKKEIIQENENLKETHLMIKNEVKKMMEPYPVPSFANKARVIEALDSLKKVHPELSVFLFDLQNFIDERIA